MAGRSITFERRKFRELILYIAQQTADDPWFGDTHLNKALYWADAKSYVRLGRPMTGARYFKLQFGPGARALKPVREELVREGLVEIQERQTRKTLPRKRPADTSLFSEEELALVDEVIAWLGGQTAGQVRDVSHEESAGWRLVGMKEDIPYYTALISSEMPSEATVAQARERAHRLGWS